jgi:predicted nucleic acid-binding protein
VSAPSAAVAPDLPDLNVWLALAWPGHPHHSRAAAYWEDMASSQVLFCTVTVLGLLRLLSQSKVMGSAGPFGVHHYSRKFWRGAHILRQCFFTIHRR